MNFDAPAVFCHSANGQDPPVGVEWNQDPVPWSGTVWNEHWGELMFVCAIGVDTLNRVWVADSPDEPVTWFEVTAMRHE